MAQIIKLRRGTLAQLNSVTLRNGELGVVTGSAVIGDAALKTAIVAGHSDGTNRLSIARIITGNATPDLSGVTGGSNFNDMLYHETDAKILYVLNTGGNTNLDLTGNIKNREIGGNVSGSSTSTGSFGYLNVVGDGVFGGNITFGDANTDSVSFSADISSTLIPNTDDTYDIGSASQAWQDLYLEGDIHLTDAGTVQTDAGALTIDSTAAGLVLDGHTGVDIDASNSGKVAIDGAGGIDIGVATDVAIDIDSAALDIDASGAITIDSTSTVSIDGADDMNFTITSGTAGEDLTIAQIGANDSSILITAAGTGTDAVSIDATAGSMVIAPSLANGKTLTIGPSSATQMVFTPHGTAASEKISLTNTAGDATDAIAVTATAGGIDIGAGTVLALDGAGGIDIGKALDVAIDVDASTFDLDASSTVHLSGSSVTLDGSGVSIAGNASEVDITTTGTVDINSAALDIDASAGLTMTSTTMAFDPSSTFDLDAAGAVTIDGSSITIGGDNDNAAINIGYSTSEVTIGDNLTVTGDLTVNGDQTIISTTNLAIEDKFAVFASGSTSATDGGIIVSNTADGSGYALGYDVGTTRWVFDANLAVNATDIAPDAYVGVVQTGTTNPAIQDPAPTYGGTTNGIGTIYIDTNASHGDQIWIYA
jgi:hypothetical protein